MMTNVSMMKGVAALLAQLGPLERLYDDELLDEFQAPPQATPALNFRWTRT